MTPTAKSGHANGAILMGIAGGTGSGKTTIAHAVARGLAPLRVAIVDADAYYRDLSHLSREARTQVNFDHPQALDAALLCEQMRTLKSGRPIAKPCYDYARHTRADATTHVAPADVLILEGILIYALPALQPLFDFKVFLDEWSDVRLIRRIERDLKTRGRSLADILRQCGESVGPMFRAHVAPTREQADLVVAPGVTIDAAAEEILAAFRHTLAPGAVQTSG
ncbi:MAG: uridine kinase [Desulfosarcinaceae bacterium]|nr:uridine kinase [Desulfosarcinaceae bacterium]